MYAFAENFGRGAGRGKGRDPEGKSSARNASFQLHAAAFDADGVFDLVAALILQVFRFLVDEALEILQARRAGPFAGFRARPISFWYSV